MAVQPVERKLAARFAADIAGYSRPTGRDEARTLAQSLSDYHQQQADCTPSAPHLRPEGMAHLPDGLRLPGLSG